MVTALKLNVEETRGTQKKSALSLYIYLITCPTVQKMREGLNKCWDNVMVGKFLITVPSINTNYLLR